MIEMPSTVVTSGGAPTGSVSTASLRPFVHLGPNAVAERVIGTLRRECLDHIIVTNEQHLASVLAEFVQYYNADRPHRTLGLQAPERKPRLITGPVRSRSVLNGLHHVYERVA